MKTLPRPKRHLTKRAGSLIGGEPEANGYVQIVSSSAEALSVVPGAPSQAMSQTQAANRLFLRRVEKIVGARAVRRTNGELYRLAYDVEVPDLWSEAADQVYTLRGDLCRKYPGAQIEIEVRGRRELGEASAPVARSEEL